MFQASNDFESARLLYKKVVQDVEELRETYKNNEKIEDDLGGLFKPIEKSTFFSSIKLMGHLDRLGRWQQENLPYPITVDVDPV